MFNQWDYNTRSDVTGAGRYWGTDLGDTNSPVGLQSFGYAYDPPTLARVGQIISFLRTQATALSVYEKECQTEDECQTLKSQAENSFKSAASNLRHDSRGRASIGSQEEQNWYDYFIKWHTSGQTQW